MTPDHDYIDILCPEREPPSKQAFDEMRVIARDAEIAKLKAELEEAREIIKAAKSIALTVLAAEEYVDFRFWNGLPREARAFLDKIRK